MKAQNLDFRAGDRIDEAAFAARTCQALALNTSIAAAERAGRRSR